jgi:hypothetical protein
MREELKILDLKGLNDLDNELHENFKLIDEALETTYLYRHNIRELALVRTKLQEARFWLLEAILKEVEDKEKVT